MINTIMGGNSKKKHRRRHKSKSLKDGQYGECHHIYVEYKDEENKNENMQRRKLGRISSLQRIPLQRIGKVESVDQEEPPEIEDVDTHFETFYQQLHQDDDEQYYYEPEHATTCATTLQKAFKVLNPGNHVCRQHGEHASSFIHCRDGVLIGRKYAELRDLLEIQAKLMLVRDFTSRINSAAMFVKDLEAVTREEYSTWHKICHNNMADSAPQTKLELLASICEDLHVHMNHWNSLKQLLYTDVWLQNLMPSLSTQMNTVRRTLFQLRDSALWWIDRLIRVGLQVLAHADLERISQESLWNITRGLEEFNTIVTTIRFTNSQESCTMHKTVPHHMVAIRSVGASGGDSERLAKRHHPAEVTCSEAVVTNSYRNIGDTIKPIPFIRVLSILAKERSKYTAVLTHRILTSNEDFLHLAYTIKAADFSWTKDTRVSGAIKWQSDKCHQASSSVMNTSDYHSASGSSYDASFSSNSLPRLGKIILPAVSKDVRSISEFTEREQEFAAKFLQIVCHSTNFIKRSLNGKHFKVTVENSPSNSPTKLKSSPCSVRDNPSPSESPVPSSTRHHRMHRDQDSTEHQRRSPKSHRRSRNHDNNNGTEVNNMRKSVCFADSADYSVMVQLTEKYMDLLWQCFNGHLMEYLNDMTWGGVDAVRTQLGSLIHCDDAVALVTVKMMQQLSTCDGIPAGAGHCVSSAARKLEVQRAWAAWDTAICVALASKTADKCHPVPLVNNEYSTKTARLLKEAFGPLHHVLNILHTNSDVCSMKANGMIAASPRNRGMLLVEPTLQRLVLTCDTAVSWCHTKSHQFLSSWALGAFLLITQSDLKILGDEITKAVYGSQWVCTPSPDTSHADGLLQRLQLHWTQLNDCNAHIQTLAGSTVKIFSAKCQEEAREFFEEAMPVGKVWKRKPNPDLPSEANVYVEQALDSLIEPVVAGVSKLRPTSQISAISMAVNAMCEAWTAYILKQKMKFSLCGAHQLGLDFGSVRTWLSGSIQNEEVKQSILALDVFKNLNGIVELLRRQPKGRSRSRGPPNRKQYTAASDDGTVEYASSVVSGSTRMTASDGGEYSDMHGYGARATNLDLEPTSYKVANPEQWLALRVHGGARNWPKLPSCFNSDS